MRIGLTFPLVIAALACSGGGSTTSPPTPPPPPPPPPPPVANAVVQVRNNFFDPEVVSVTAGGTVRWEWAGQDHNVTSVLTPTFTPDSPTRNAPFSHGPLTFPTPGTYRYICTIHGAVSGAQTTGMRGTVIVQ